MPAKKKGEIIDEESLGSMDMPLPMPVLHKSKSVMQPLTKNRGLGMLDEPVTRDEDSTSTAPTSKSKKSGA